MLCGRSQREYDTLPSRCRFIYSECSCAERWTNALGNENLRDGCLNVHAGRMSHSCPWAYAIKCKPIDSRRVVPEAWLRSPWGTLRSNGSQKAMGSKALHMNEVVNDRMYLTWITANYKTRYLTKQHKHRCRRGQPVQSMADRNSHKYFQGKKSKDENNSKIKSKSQNESRRMT